MSFSENLKQIRKEHHLSQEELAELLDVSRQAVSKWEQGQGYPEVEKLLVLSRKLNVSLDALMSVESDGVASERHETVSGFIVITSPNEHVIANCCKVSASGKMRGGKIRRNTHCSVSAKAVLLSGGNRRPSLAGMPIRR